MTQQADELEQQKIITAQYENLRQQLERRCNAAKIELQEIKDDSLVDPFERFLLMQLPNGREKRKLALFDNEDIQNILSFNFEEYTYLGDLAAIGNYSKNTIEAGIRLLGAGTMNLAMRRLYPTIFQEQHEEGEEDRKKETPPIELVDPMDKLGGKIVLGPPSKEFKVLCSRRCPLSISLFNFKITQHDEALNKLNHAANSIFFEIDLSRDVPLSLLPYRRLRPRPTTRPGSKEFPPLQFPKNDYDEAPMALYWYARSATGMPLLQYLAYYQSLEFYFPTFAQVEARKIVRNFLKNPTFRPERDADLAKMLTAISGLGHQYGDERSQLRATLNECLDAEMLRSYFTENDQRKAHFSTKIKGLTEKKIPIADSSA
jgi:hypothetical protein